MKKLAKAFLAPLAILLLSCGRAGGEVSSGQTNHNDSSGEPSSEQQPYAGYGDP